MLAVFFTPPPLTAYLALLPKGEKMKIVDEDECLEREWIARKSVRVNENNYIAKGVIFSDIWPKSEQAEDWPGDMDLFIHYDALLDIYDHTWGTNC